MTTEELLKPRYKVIADYPNSIFKKGEISEQFFVGESVPFYDMSLFEKYPHLFRKLEWWEDREPGYLPDYVRCLATSNIRKLNTQMISAGWAVMEDYFPATREEYEQYISK